MIKQMIVSTKLGALALGLRDRAVLQAQVWSNLEAVAGMSNDILARVLVERLCRQGGVFIDVGAHLGSVINGALRNSRPSQVIAFEAIPAKARELKRRFPKVQIHCCAVGDCDGNATFYIDNVRTGFSSLDQNVTKNSRTTAIPVRIKKLDDIIDDDRVDLVKIDVEGAELGVLMGASNTINRSRPTIMFESGVGEMHPYTKTALWNWFADRGYEIVLPNRLAHEGPGLTLDTFLYAHIYPRLATNYFAVASEKRSITKARARQVLSLD